MKRAKLKQKPEQRKARIGKAVLHLIDSRAYWIMPHLQDRRALASRD
jgi:hypothetical protein